LLSALTQSKTNNTAMQQRAPLVLNLSDIPSGLSDLCEAADKAAEVLKTPQNVFWMPEFQYAFGELANTDLPKMVCYLNALKAAVRENGSPGNLRLLSLKLSAKRSGASATATQRVYDAAHVKVNAAYPGTFLHAADMQAVIVSYYDFAPAAHAAWPAYINFPMPRAFTVPTKDRARALHARETHLRALMYTILCTDAHALAKCRGASARKNKARARKLLEPARIQQYILLNITASGSIVPHEHDDASTIEDAALKRTLAEVHAVHRQAVVDVFFDSSDDDDFDEDASEPTELEMRHNKLITDPRRSRSRSLSPPPLLSNTRKRACKA
jgi:hypothetical protein